MESKEVAVQNRSTELDLLPSKETWEQLKDIAEAAVKSGLLPGAVKNKETAAIIALKGWELGLKPMVAFSNIHVVNGKPGCSAELLLAGIRQRYPGSKIRFKQMDEKACVIEAKRHDEEHSDTFTFTIEEAERAKLTGKDVWKAYAVDMLRARAITRMKRAKWPEVMMGLDHTPEELEPITAEFQRVVEPVSPIEPEVKSVAEIGKKEIAEEPKKKPAPEKEPEPAHDIGPQQDRKTVQELAGEATKKRADLSRDIFAEMKRVKMEMPDLVDTIKKTFNKGMKELTIAEMEETLAQLKGLPS